MTFVDPIDPQSEQLDELSLESASAAILSPAAPPSVTSEAAPSPETTVQGESPAPSEDGSIPDGGSDTTAVGESTETSVPPAEGEPTAPTDSTSTTTAAPGAETSDPTTTVSPGAETPDSEVFPIAGCSSGFTEGDRLDLQQKVGPYTQSFPVEVTGIDRDVVTFTSLTGHPEGVGRGIEFRFVEFEGRTYLKVEAWGPGSLITGLPIISDINDSIAETAWSTLAGNLRARAGQL